MKTFLLTATIALSALFISSAFAAGCPDISGEWHCMDPDNFQTMYKMYHEHMTYYGDGYNMYYYNGSLLYSNGVPYSPCGLYKNTFTLSCESGSLHFTYKHRERMDEELVAYDDLVYTLSDDKETMTIKGKRAIAFGVKGIVFWPSNAVCTHHNMSMAQ